MDKVQDESQISQEKRSFEEDSAAADSLAEKGQGSASDEDSRISMSMWENHPPYAQLNQTTVLASDTTLFKKKQRAKLRAGKPSKVQMTCHKIVSLIIAIALIVAIWGLLSLAPLCYFEVGICTNSTEDAQVSTASSLMSRVDD